ncbi:cop9 signalosome complex subunit 3 [Diaporthe amygdali]|uniref:cop9 signalosome complex subunit 3 n=1 Tax=Phomopsis amygdali TaxID=1214568 RepID=UPI0022FEF1F1|nr:cop9 signalosome complex subunit 3 [Diaporthe amygdali]KAJ0120110.1 cop9 signalosome complex subunit 3 [Diaporthe amygdali]
MDNAVSVLLGFPPSQPFATDEDYDNAVNFHLQQIDRLFSKETATIAQQGINILKLLDPAVNSISYLAVFNTLSETTAFSSEQRLNALVTFLLTFDPRQIRYVGNHLTTWLDKVASGTLLPHDLAVEVLAKAILRLDPSGAMLTSHHLSLVRLAYDNNVAEPAFQVTDKQIVYFPGMSRDQGSANRAANAPTQKPLCDLSLPPTGYIMVETGLTTAVTVDQVLQYDFTCGLLYCSKRQWQKARAAFERVITHPTRDGGVSKIMTEAFSKWVLVSLLINGRTPTIPATTGPNATKTCETMAKPYLAIASHFDSMSATNLKAEVEANSGVWANDRNTGLIQEVLAAHQKWQIIDMRKVYSKVSLADIRQQTSSAETGDLLPSDKDVEALIQGMISSGMLNGVIEKPADKSPYLKYLSESGDLSEKQFQSEIAAIFAKMKDLEAIYKATSARLSTNPHYIKQHIRESQREKELGHNKGASFEAAVDDEDLMTGLTEGGAM